MRRATLLCLVGVSAMLALAQVTAMPVSAQRRCGTDKQGNPIECEPRENNGQQPEVPPPTATFTETPKPTATFTPKPTQTNTPEPTASLAPVAAAIVPPPAPKPNGPDCSPSPWALIAGAALLGAGGLGLYMSRTGGGAPGSSWQTFRGQQGEGALSASYRSIANSSGDQSPGAGAGNAFAYQPSGAQQRLVNTAFGDGSVRPNDRLRGAGPSTSGWTQILASVALLAGAGVLAALGLGSAGIVPCGSVVPAALGGGLLGAALGAGFRAGLLRKPPASGHGGHAGHAADGFPHAEGFGVDVPDSGAVSLDAELDLVPDFELQHDDVHVVLNTGHISTGPTVAAKKSAVHFDAGLGAALDVDAGEARLPGAREEGSSGEGDADGDDEDAKGS